MSNKQDDFEELVVKFLSFYLRKFVARWIEKIMLVIYLVSIRIRRWN